MEKDDLYKHIMDCAAGEGDLYWDLCYTCIAIKLE